MGRVWCFGVAPLEEFVILYRMRQQFSGALVDVDASERESKDRQRPGGRRCWWYL